MENCGFISQRWWRSPWQSQLALWLEPGLALAVCSVLLGDCPVSWVLLPEPRHIARRCQGGPTGLYCPCCSLRQGQYTQAAPVPECVPLRAPMSLLRGLCPASVRCALVGVGRNSACTAPSLSHRTKRPPAGYGSPGHRGDTGHPPTWWPCLLGPSAGTLSLFSWRVTRRLLSRMALLSLFTAGHELPGWVTRRHSRALTLPPSQGTS